MLAYANHRTTRRLPVLALLFILGAGAARAGDEQARFLDAFGACQARTDTLERLRCYDSLSLPPGAPTDVTLSEETIAALPGIDERQRRLDTARLESLSRSEERGMLTADNPNYITYVTPVGDDLGDERHVEFYLSLKYPLVDEWLGKRKAAFRDWDSSLGRRLDAFTPDRLLLHYNALYDFYAAESDRYDSAPILSRRQNPGISLEYDFAQGKDTLRIGWFHESNGQELEPGDELRFDSLRNTFGDDFALAKVSRGWDYAMARWSSSSLLFEDPLEAPWLNYQVEARLYCNCQGFGFVDGREDDIWWEPGADIDIETFDGLRATVQGSLMRGRLSNMSLDARLDVRTGLEKDFADKWTGRLSLDARWEKVRLTLFYFDGYGHSPSVYHLRTQYAGIGLELR